MKNASIISFILKALISALISFGLWQMVKPYWEGKENVEQEEISAKLPFDNTPMPSESITEYWMPSPLELIVYTDDEEARKVFPAMPSLTTEQLAVKSPQQQWLLLGQYLGELQYYLVYKNGEQMNKATKTAKQCQLLLQQLNSQTNDPIISLLANNSYTKEWYQAPQDLLLYIEVLIEEYASKTTLIQQSPAILVSLGIWSKLNQIFIHHKEIAPSSIREKVLEQKINVERFYVLYGNYLDYHHSNLNGALLELNQIYEDVEIELVAMDIMVEQGCVMPIPGDTTHENIRTSPETYLLVIEKLTAFQSIIEAEAGLR